MLDTIMYYQHVVGLRGLLSAARGKAAKTLRLLEMRRPDVRFPFFLRVPTSDVCVFEQILIHREYDFEVERMPATIIDAGANIGLASIFFANRFPEARIVAIEPEEGNFDILVKNVAPYGNIVPLRAALWHENRNIHLVDPCLGHWGFMTQDAGEGGNGERPFGRTLHQVQALTLDRIMRDHDIDHVDILKIDIEGAEREVFRDPSAWLDKVDALIVELHERLKPGCNRSFYNSTQGFDREWLQGENVYLARSHSCLARRAA